MRERPILFSTEMVKAILEGRKTQTRRTKDLDLYNKINPDYWKLVGVGSYQKKGHNARTGVAMMANATNQTFSDFCPYGNPGDVLWVRETWAKIKEFDGVLYKAAGDDPMRCGKWKPSIHMPKVAARIWLEITDIRVERLQDISEEDACAEGVEYKVSRGGLYYKDYMIERDWYFKAKPSFFSLWRKINGTDSLHANPWVWVISFKVLSTTGKPAELGKEAAHA
jgi:hypothetical protein